MGVVNRETYSKVREVEQGGCDEGYEGMLYRHV